MVGDICREKGEITRTNWVRSPGFPIGLGPNYYLCVVFHLEP